MSAHHAKKSLGQNFLVDPNQQRRIVAALDPQPDDTIIEIGPGQGALTRHIAGSVARLVLVELDRDLATALAHEFDGRDDVEVVEADILDLDLRTIARTDPHRTKIVGNIPYNITTPIIFHLLQRSVRPARIVLMIQREVADRIIAAPGESEYGALSVGVRSIARVERLFNVGRNSFRPVPRVDSTVIRISPIVPPPLTAAEEDDLRVLTRAAFSWRRKQLQKTLRAAPEFALDAAAIADLEDRTGVRLDQRPEDLSPEHLIALSRALRDATHEPDPTGPAGHPEWNAVLGHELRSPIAAILGYEELIEDGTFGDLPAQALDSLRRIALAARQLLLLVDAVEHSDVTDVDAEPAVHLDADELCRDAADAVRLDADVRGTTILCELAPFRLLVHREPALRALVLILGAAIKTSPGATLQLSAADQPVPRITVAGADIDPDRDSIAPGRPLTGAALRLHLARAAARQAGGSIELDPSGSIHLDLPG